MRPELSRRLFLLASPGEGGYGNVRPFFPGAQVTRRACAGEGGPAETLLLFCPGNGEPVPGDVLFSADAVSLDHPLYLIRSVRPFGDHAEAEAVRLDMP